MKDEMIQSKVEECFNDNSELVLNEGGNVGLFEQYKRSTAIRVVKVWNKYKRDSIFQLDFETSLRNYLLLMRNNVVIQGYQPSPNFEKLGLKMDTKNGKIWIESYFPTFVNDELVKRVYMQEYEEQNTINKHFLHTNSYIRQLSAGKFQYYKSNEQKLAVTGALKTPDGYTCLVSMSTGGGKSLVTQSIAYQKSGLTVVIVPTISLMIDQAQNAKSIIESDVNSEIFYYHSGCSLNSFISAVNEKRARLLFVSPESLIKNEKLRETIEEANNSGYLNNFVIDEAHIVIEWGSAFRIDFQCLDVYLKSLKVKNSKLRTFLLSATYSDETINQLKLFYGYDDKWIEIRCDRLRHEIVYDINKCNSSDKSRKMIDAIMLLPRPMIVYVKSPDDAVDLQNRLIEIGYNSTHIFTGKTVNSDRENLISMWKNNEFDLMIATCAFGVGVDKKDVRTVLHAYIPENPNKYYQEAGRGGRDGLPCLSEVLYEDNDVESAFSFVSKVITTEKLKGRWFSMLTSTKTQVLLDGKYLIDTYVKPSYNEDEIYVDSISNQDINWNVYVILFMRRSNLLTIDDVKYVNSKYLFYITIIERKLLLNDSAINILLEDIRNQEWKNAETEFYIIKNNLYKIGKVCWSTMLNKVYRETDEYCAGCNAHLSVNDFEDEKTVKRNVDIPLLLIDKKVSEYMYDSRWISVISTNIKKHIVDLINIGIDTIVADTDTISEIVNNVSENNTSLLMCNYLEWIELSSGKNYFVSGAILVLVPRDVYIQRQIFSIIDKNVKTFNMAYVICAEQDYKLDFKGKNLSAYVTGPCMII